MAVVRGLLQSRPKTCYQIMSMFGYEEPYLYLGLFHTAAVLTLCFIVFGDWCSYLSWAHLAWAEFDATVYQSSFSRSWSIFCQ